MIIDRLTSHGDRIVYRPHPSPGFNGHTEQAKRAAASLFGVEVPDLFEVEGGGVVVWRAGRRVPKIIQGGGVELTGKLAPRITLTRTSSMLQVEGSLRVPAGESNLSGTLLMVSLAPVARRAACLLMGYSDRVIVGDGIGWVWTVDLTNVTAQDVE